MNIDEAIILELAWRTQKYLPPHQQRLLSEAFVTLSRAADRISVRLCPYPQESRHDRP